MKRLALSGLLLASALVLPAAAALGAPPRCGDRAEIVAQLEQRYGESQRAFGLASGHGVFEVFASDAGSWTILFTRPGGQSCLMAAGRDFQEVPPKEGLQGQPA